MDQSISKVLIIQIGQRAELVSELVSPARTHGNLDPLAPLHDQLSESTVKMVEVPELIECSPGEELVRIRGRHKRKAEGRETVVVVMLQNVQSERFIRTIRPRDLSRSSCC